MMDAVPKPASILIAAAAFTGARRGEFRGMFWENYRDGELLIARSIWNGITTDPKSRKSKAPARTAATGKFAAGDMALSGLTMPLACMTCSRGV